MRKVFSSPEERFLYWEATRKRHNAHSKRVRACQKELLLLAENIQNEYEPEFRKAQGACESLEYPEKEIEQQLQIIKDARNAIVKLKDKYTEDKNVLMEELRLLGVNMHKEKVKRQDQLMSDFFPDMKDDAIYSASIWKPVEDFL